MAGGEVLIPLTGCCFSTESAIYGVKIKLKVLIYRCKLRFFARFCLVYGSAQRISTACEGTSEQVMSSALASIMSSFIVDNLRYS